MYIFTKNMDMVVIFFILILVFSQNRQAILIFLLMLYIIFRSTANTKGLEELKVAHQFNNRYLGAAIGDHL